jgi:hypothetical protein
MHFWVNRKYSVAVLQRLKTKNVLFSLPRRALNIIRLTYLLAATNRKKLHLSDAIYKISNGWVDHEIIGQLWTTKKLFPAAVSCCCAQQICSGLGVQRPCRRRSVIVVQVSVMVH